MAERRLTAQIDLDAVAYNFDQMKGNMAAQTKFIAVIKANAYGHGAAAIARFLAKREDVWGFAAATTEEAVILRENKITKPIMLLGYTFPEDYPQVIAHDIRPAVFTMEMAEQLSQEAVRQKKAVKMHIAVDTGMSRIGFADVDESVEEIRKIAALPQVELEGMFTHFARADETSLDPAVTQMQRYQAFYEKVRAAGINITYRHISNSAGIMQFSEANLDLVRSGISIYGLLPSDEVRTDMVKLRPVMSLLSHVAYVKTVPEGVAVSYGGTFVTKRESVIATIPAGYADGISRGLSNKGFVCIHGKRAPIVGRVCMDQFMVDVTEIEDVKTGDPVVLVGKDGEEQITLEELGNVSGRFHYEFACCINERVPRIYYYQGKRIEDLSKL